MYQVEVKIVELFPLALQLHHDLSGVSNNKVLIVITKIQQIQYFLLPTLIFIICVFCHYLKILMGGKRMKVLPVGPAANQSAVDPLQEFSPGGWI